MGGRNSTRWLLILGAAFRGAFSSVTKNQKEGRKNGPRGGGKRGNTVTVGRTNLGCRGGRLRTKGIPLGAG